MSSIEERRCFISLLIGNKIQAAREDLQQPYIEIPRRKLIFWIEHPILGFRRSALRGGTGFI